jgi:Mg2+-importing ATPase
MKPTEILPEPSMPTRGSIEDIFRNLETSRAGLSSAEAARRFKKYGPNEFAEKKRIRPAFILFSKFKNPLLLLLLVAAAVSISLGSVFEGGVIIVIVLGSAAIDFFNTYKSAKAAESLQEKVNITAAVMRDGEIKERKIQDIVPGDIFALAAGDLVPADGMLFEAKDLFLNESVLTGESMPVEKTALRSGQGTVLMEASVVSGEGLAVAVATGARTKIGSIAHKLESPSVPTEFEKNLKDFSIFIFRTTLFLVLAVILLNIFFLKRDMLQVFLFAVAIAVGLTPELLPLIVTSNLSKGALAMSKNGVIVKKLAAIHNFGSVDVLCTDKTGTLTEDRIALVRCVDGFGEDSASALFWGQLSSTHRTGVRGVLDKAIAEYRKVDLSGWEKVDEIPFDAVRRFESVIVKKGSETVMITKGAPEEILKNAKSYCLSPGVSSKKIIEVGSEKDLVPKMRSEMMAIYNGLSSDGFRVLGIAVKNVPLKIVSYEKKDENDFSFVGFLAFLDPPKKSVKATLEKMETHHVAMKIITGDNFLVTKKIAEEIGLVVQGAFTGEEIAKMDEAVLQKNVELANIFTRVAPEDKEHIIRALRANGHVVAYLGDGVNDVLSIKAADVGISVNNAVDVAKETADIILLRKGLGEIIDGIVEGRKTFANTFKYLMMALSSNFGNMFSMPIASLFLPFLPMTAPQILLNNFLYDSSQLAIPFDNVDPSFLTRPKKFDIGFMKKFMIIFGPLSSCFDAITFVAMGLVFHFAAAGFQTGWFLESIATQTFVVMIVRMRGDFWKNRPAVALILSSLGAVVVAWIVPYTPFGAMLGFMHLGIVPIACIACIVVVYLFSVELVKKYFYRKYGGLIEK